MKNSIRFDTILGAEYQMLQYAYPHHDEFQQTVGQQVADFSKHLNTDHFSIIEAGAGTGITTVQILNADPRVHVIAIDNSKVILDQGKEILAEYSDRIEFQLGDLNEKLSTIPDKTVDGFVAVWTLHNLQPNYREITFAEIARVLKPGGFFVSGDKYAPDDLAQHKQELNEQLALFEKFATMGHSDLARAWVEHNKQDDLIRMTETEQYRQLEAQGFTHIKTVYRKKMEAIITAII